jgi:hypothetical protein
MGDRRPRRVTPSPRSGTKGDAMSERFRNLGEAARWTVRAEAAVQRETAGYVLGRSATINADAHRLAAEAERLRWEARMIRAAAPDPR